VVSDPELAAAVDGHDNWQMDGDDAEVYAPLASPGHCQGSAATPPTWHDRYLVSIIRDGRAAYTIPCFSAVEAVSLAERIRVIAYSANGLLNWGFMA
jgi:hypothetical protein